MKNFLCILFLSAVWGISHAQDYIVIPPRDPQIIDDTEVIYKDFRDISSREVYVDFPGAIGDPVNTGGITVVKEKGPGLVTGQNLANGAFSSDKRLNITFTDVNDFENGATYKVTIPNNVIPGFSEAITWNFTTYRPGFDYYPDRDNEPWSVKIDEPLKLIFNEAIALDVTDRYKDIKIYKVKIRNVGSGEDIGEIFEEMVTETVEVTSTAIADEEREDGTIRREKNVLLINHADFAAGTSYRVILPTRVVNGQGSTIPSGGAEGTPWFFTTGAAQPETHSPAEGATNVALNEVVSLEYDGVIVEGYEFSKIKISWIVNGAEREVVSQGRASIDGTVLTIAHDPFEEGKTYRVTIPSWATNGKTSVVSWTFTATGTLLGASEMNLLNARLYPNPLQAETEFTIETDDIGRTSRMIEIFNATGALVMKTETFDRLIRLTAPKERGVYLLRFTTGGQIGTYRLVVY